MIRVDKARSRGDATREGAPALQLRHQLVLQGSYRWYSRSRW